MKYLFSARHASYGSDDRISDEGKKEMENLADSIKGIIGDQSAYIVSSIALRALDSAEILMSRLGF